MNARSVGIGMVVAGAVCLVTGLVVDVLQVTDDPNLAVREGVFALSRFPQMLFFGGLCLLVLGPVTMLLGPLLYGPGDEPRVGRRLVQVGAPLAAVALVAGCATVASSSALADGSVVTGSALGAAGGHTGVAGHSHGATDPESGAAQIVLNADGTYTHPDGSVHTAEEHASLVASGAVSTVAGGAADPAAAGGHSHGTGAGDEPMIMADGTSPCEQTGAPASEGQAAGGHGHRGPAVTAYVTDPAQRAKLTDELSRAQAAVLRYPTAADAKAAGYFRVTGYVPCIGAHWMKFSIVDGTFDPDEPEMILYDGHGLDAKVVGLSYYVVSGDTPPEGFSTDEPWHQHIGLCINGTGVIGAENLTEEECAARGGRKATGSDSWMNHVWNVPGWESSWGIFSGEHPELGALPPGQDALWKS